MTCARCGRPDVPVGTTCPTCGEWVVDPSVLDSLLSMPAEAVPDEGDGPADRPADLPLLTVDPGMAEMPIDVGDRVDPASRPGASWEPPPEWEAPAGEWAPRSMADGSRGLADVPNPPDQSPRVATSPLPRRTPLAATEPQWGPRTHPAAVMAPPPPHPLDAPVSARRSRSSGTGLPAGLAGRGPAPMPVAPPRPPASASSPSIRPLRGSERESLPVPERPSHPRVRRWFGRGVVPDDAEGGEPSDDTVPGDGRFEGAPDGLLDGIRPEAQREPGVHDPAGIEAAMSRLSTGARRAVLAPLGIVAALLESEEVAEAVVQGEYQQRPAAVVLTDRRVIVANDRRWAPDVRVFGLGSELTVHGWQDDRRATLVFVVGAVGVVVEGIGDRPLARDLAQRVRARCEGGPAGLEPLA